MTDKPRRQQTQKENSLLVVLSVIIALLLWTYVVMQVNPTTKLTIPGVSVQLLNTESLTARGLAVAGLTENLIDVTVEGKRSDISKMTVDQVVAEADAFGWSQGENYIPVTVHLPDGVRQVDVKANKIRVLIEELVVLKRPVAVIYKGTLPENTEAGPVTVQPEEVEVRGAKSEVEAVKELQATIDIAKMGQIGGIRKVELVPVNKEGTKVENVRLSVATVEIDYRLYSLKEVPLEVKTIGQVGNSRQVELDYPKTITIKGLSADLREITKVTAAPVDLQKHPAGGIFDLQLQLPDTVQPADKNKLVQVTVKVIETVSRSFSFGTDQIEWRGLPLGKTVAIEPGTVTVSVSGAKKLVDELAAERIHPFVDARQLVEGSQQAPLLAETDAAGLSLKTAPATVRVTVSVGAEPPAESINP